MPLYDFECDNCCERFERRVHFEERLKQNCEVCNNPARYVATFAANLDIGGGYDNTGFPSNCYTTIQKELVYEGTSDASKLVEKVKDTSHADPIMSRILEIKEKLSSTGPAEWAVLEYQRQLKELENELEYKTKGFIA